MDETTSKQIIDILNDINDNTVSTYNAINDVQEYLIIQDKKLKEKEEKQEEIEAEKSETEALTKQEQSANAEEQAETYETLLMDIRAEQQLTNQLISGSILFLGIIAGILLFKILWDKLK